jgi:hypothetical protein
VNKRKAKKVIRAFSKMEKYFEGTLEGQGYEILGTGTAGQGYTNILRGEDFRYVDENIPKRLQKFYLGVSTERVFSPAYNQGPHRFQNFEDRITGLWLDI